MTYALALRTGALVVFVLAIVVSTAASQPHPWADTSLSPKERAQLLVAAMTQAEKLAMVHGMAGTPREPIEAKLDYAFSLSTSVSADSCIDVKDASTSNGADIQIWTCNDTSAQFFTLEDLGSGVIRFRNTASNRCLDVTGGGTADGTLLQLWDCNMSAAQSFTYTRDGDHYELVNTGSNKCVDLAGGAATSGTAIQIYACNDSAAQRWAAYQPRYTGDVPAIARLDFPALRLQDGPCGVARNGSATQFPAPITLAASWDRALAQEYGEKLAIEHAGKGANVVLGPMMNITRVPAAGRNFEGLGEDPLLVGRLAAAITRGIQDEGLIATIKHFIDNEQETERGTIDVLIDDRTQHEIYLPPFAACVAEKPGAVMCGYNKVNGAWACENGPTQNGWLKGELGFEGFIMSDWGAVHGTASYANGGLDLEMPDALHFGSLGEAIDSNEVSQSRLDDMVLRIATSTFAAGIYDRAPSGSPGNDGATPAHADFAQKVAEQGLVLLKNEGDLLPLSADDVTSIAVIGDAADAAPITAGDGSSYVRVSDVVTAREGIEARAGSIEVTYVDSDLGAATTAAGNADVAVVVVGVTSAEAVDRPDIALPDDALVSAVVAANPNTVVIVYAPAQVTMPWASDVPAALYGFLPGQEGGAALAAVLFGDVNPSGRLPLSIAKSADDYPANTPARFPGEDGVVEYSEGWAIGYRHFDAAEIEPLFPFGHGLSYASFEYANFTSSADTIGANDRIAIGIDITNTGAVRGIETVQLYLRFPSEASEPPQQLKGFERVDLMPEQTKHVELTLSPSDFSFWSAGLARWTPYPGEYEVLIGASSRDIRQQGTITVSGGPLVGTLYQAETAALDGGAAQKSDHTGFTGDAFVALDTPGSAVTFSVSAAEAGRYSATVRYSNVREPRTLTLYVDDAKVRQLSFPWLANLDTWDFVTEPLDLDAGEHTLRYAFDASDSGGVNLDAVIFGLEPRNEQPDGGVDGGQTDGGALDAGSCNGPTCADGGGAGRGDGDASGADAGTSRSDSGCACTLLGAAHRPRSSGMLVLLVSALGVTVWRLRRARSRGARR